MKGASPKDPKRESRERPVRTGFNLADRCNKRNASSHRREPGSRSAPSRASPRETVSYASASRITSLVVDSLSAAFASILKFDGPSDVLLSRFFRLHPSLGQRDRGLIAEAVFFALRRYATLAWLMQPAHPARAARFAALLTLARQHGLDSIDQRALRGDAKAVEHALSIDVAHAPAAVQSELPEWLFTEVERQYEDAAPLIDALKQSAPLDLRVNSIKASRADVLEELVAHHVGAVPTPYSPGCDSLVEQTGVDKLARLPGGAHRSAGRRQPADRSTAAAAPRRNGRRFLRRRRRQDTCTGSVDAFQRTPVCVRCQ